MNPFLSVLVPGIRTKNWYHLYKSIEASTKMTFEVIFVGPYEPPSDVAQFKNVKYIKDWGSPIRCQQIALIHAEGEYINWAADDGEFYPGCHDVSIKLLEESDNVPLYKNFIMGKYYEGSASHNEGVMDKDHYYILNHHDASRSRYFKKDYFMLNLGLVPTKLLIEVGGWDAENFEVCPMAYNDLAIRLQNYDCKVIIQDEMMFQCSHLPGHAGDHGPIHDGQVFHDQPVFTNIYSQEGCMNRVKIDLNNWSKAPNRWPRRFGV